MIRDDERTHGPVRRTERPRVIYRPPESTYRVPVALRIAPPRRRPGPALLIVVALVVVAVGVAFTARTVVGPSVSGRVAGGEAPGETSGETSAIAGPDVMVPPAIRPSVPGFVSTLRGIADDTVSLTANGEPIELEPGGQFRIHLPQGVTSVALEATDGAGTANTTAVVVTDQPEPPAYPQTRAVHVRAIDWINPVVHDAVVALARSGQINAVQLDIKDEVGEIGYDSDVALADTVGATASAYYDARAALDELHALGVRVIGRIVCFLDPLMGGWAWSQGRSDMVVLDGAGATPLANNYGAAAFSNVANAEVRQYQMDLAVEGAELGFDEILYDYVRRPEGDLAEMTFEGLEIPPEVQVARFVADTNALLEPLGVELGVSVFGISASRPLPTAQDIGLLAPNVDYVSPMVYPSHWGAGEYGVANPNGQPYDIVKASLDDFERLIAGSGAAMVPWLQDFDYGGLAYGPDQVRAQIQATYDAGGEGFLLWNAYSDYTLSALDPVFPPNEAAPAPSGD